MGSVRLGKYFRLNASKSGVSVSGGISGMRLSIGSKGIRTHVTVPGTGYTKTNTLVSFKKLWKKQKQKKEEAVQTSGQAPEAKPEEAVEQQKEMMVEDELVLMMVRRKPRGRFSDKAKGDRAFNKGIEAYEREAYEETMEHFEEAMGLYGEDREVSLYMAIISYLELEDYKKALLYFKQIPQDLLNEDMQLAIADCQYELGDFSDSIETLEGFKFEDEEDMERMTLLARNHMERDNEPVAEALLKEAIGSKRKMTPYLMEAKYQLGDLYLRRKDYGQAKEFLMAVYMEDNNYEDIGSKVEELAFSGDEAD